eukprot:6211150-Pyramimonas_sp.AAC.1
MILPAGLHVASVGAAATAWAAWSQPDSAKTDGPMLKPPPTAKGLLAAWGALGTTHSASALLLLKPTLTST